MRRITKVHDIRGLQETVPVKLYVFDILMKERESLVNVVLRDRWSILERTVPGDLLVPRTVTADPMVAIDFYNRALSEGHEGLMAKDLQSVYAVGRRGKKWLKVKKSQTLDLVIIAAEWGYGKREGWLSDYHLAAVSGEGYSMVGKTFKGLTDEEFKWMTERLLATAVRKSEHVVEVRPTLVVEVAFDEIQESPTYQSGLTLRFARIKNIRQDKDPPDADTIETMRAMYEGQFRTKDRFASNDGR
jgi:DNA ligase-1